MSRPDRVIIVACSAQKRRFRTRTPAWKVYDGPVWKTLVTSVREADRQGKETPFRIALSARYGFIFDGQAIEYYDQALTPSRAKQILAEPALMRDLKVSNTAEVLLAGSKFYRGVMLAALDQVGYRGKIIEPHPARGIGDIRKAVRDFVLASPPVAMTR